MIVFINAVMDMGLLLILIASAVIILRSENMLGIVLLSGMYSVTLSALFVVLDAVDVAFTEAAVGAGASTVLMLAVIKNTDSARYEWRRPSTGAVLLGLGMGALLIVGTLDMAVYGLADAPVHSHLAPRFLDDSMTEIGIPNAVTSVLASYRGYDTLGEVVAIFTAGVAVIILLSGTRGKSAGAALLSSNPVISSALFRVIPLVILFALYVQFHGDYGPGGGFQAGVIFAAGFITWALLSGTDQLLNMLTERRLEMAAAAGVLLYGAVGVAALAAGGNFLDYSVLADEQTAGQHIGILLIELGVGMTVAFTMISLYVNFSGDRGISEQE